MVDRGGRDDRRTRPPGAVAAALLALLGIVAYVAIDAALVFLRPSLSILHSAESEYGSVGPWAWLMDVNFLVRCALSLAAVRAISLAGEAGRGLRTGLTLLVVWALGSALLAFFPTDAAGSPVTRTGAVHLAAAFVAFAAVAAGTIAATRALRSQGPWRRAAGPMAGLAWGALVPFALIFGLGFGPHSFGATAEKLFLGLELLWLAVASAAVVAASRAD
jgi:Protein of unknown function (DUF998)